MGRDTPKQGWGYRVLHWYELPIRLFRERTSVQLIVSHLLVVFISVLLIYAAILGSLLGLVPIERIRGLSDISIDPFLGERARSYVYWMQPDRLEDVFADGVSTEEASALTALLRTITQGEIPGFESNATEVDLGRIEYAAFLDPSGAVVATSDPSWVASGASGDAFPRRATREVAAYALSQQANPAREMVYGLDVTGDRTSASVPIITSDGDFVGVFIIEGGQLGDMLGPDRGSILRDLARQYVQQLWLFMIPAFVVAVPIGVWRSRTLSRRLKRLEGAAASLAQGNLQTRVIVSRHDEIGKLADRFNEMGERIEKNDRDRRAFVSNVSHELRTPVAIIHGATERLIEQQERGETVDPAALDIVRRETETLTRLIDDLFTLTRIEEHSLRLEREPISLGALSREVVRSLSELAWSQRKVRIESLVSPDLALVNADPTRVRQVINNLLYNALRHTPEGGLIVIQAKEREGFVEVSISDTGMGIPPEALENVFDRYYQAERSQRHSEGSGLGLNIVRQLVESHGGTISVESIVGQGTTFRFTLPIHA